MYRQNKIMISGILLILILSGCGHQKVLVKKAPERPHPRAITNYIDGVFYDMNKNPAAALLSYQEALLYDSTSSDIHLAIGLAYLNLGKVNPGVMALKRALKFNPGEDEALKVLAEVYLQHNELDKAERTFQQMLANDSTNVDACLGLGMIAQQTRENDKAKKYYRKCLALDPYFDSRIYDFLGMLFLQDGEFDEGEKIYQQSLKNFPDNGLAYNRLGMVYEARGDTLSAIKNYQLAIKYAPGFKDPVGRLNMIYMNRKSWGKARQLFRSMIQADTTDIESWLGLGTVFATSGILDSAKAVFSGMRDRFPQDGRASVNLGELYMDEEAWLEAFYAFVDVTEKFPDSPEGWMRCGRALFFADSLKKSEYYFRQTLDRNKDDLLANYFLGSLLIQLNRNLDAVPYLEKSLEAISDSARRLPIIGSLASAYDGLKRYQMADSLFKQALTIEPANSTILNNYGYSLAIRGQRLEDALSMALQALEQEPENGSFLDTVGWIYYLMGKYDVAEGYLAKAWEVRKESAEVADHLGDVYSKLGKMDDAVNLWQAALDLEPDNEIIRAKLEK